MFFMINILFVFHLLYVPKLVFVISSLQLFSFSTKRKFLCGAIVDYFDRLNLIDCYTWFSAFMILISSSFNSFLDQRQVVYTVETLEFQNFSQNSQINFNSEILLATINMFVSDTWFGGHSTYGIKFHYVSNRVKKILCQTQQADLQITA